MEYIPLLPRMSVSRFDGVVASINFVYDVVAVVLTNGDIFIGSVYKYWKNDYYARFWDWDYNVILPLAFNTPKGQHFGETAVVCIPIDLIAEINVFRIQGYADFPVQAYPNPLASIIYNHNMRLALTHSLKTGEYSEHGFNQDAIPPKGIFFETDLLLYVDWPSFTTSVHGSTSISVNILPGIMTINKDGSKSSEEMVLHELRKAVASDPPENQHPIGTYTHFQGCIFPSEPPQTDTIEGEECYLYKMVETRAGGETIPVCLKTNVLKYPLGFFNRINSALTFYGELLPIPIRMFGEDFNNALLARAIAYLTK